MFSLLKLYTELFRLCILELDGEPLLPVTDAGSLLAEATTDADGFFLERVTYE